jgi:hypothetical protein
MGIPQAMKCHCRRCDHRWVKRIEGRPVRCPECKQPNWDKEVGELKVGRPRGVKKAPGKTRKAR